MNDINRLNSYLCIKGELGCFTVEDNVWTLRRSRWLQYYPRSENYLIAFIIILARAMGIKSNKLLFLA